MKLRPDHMVPSTQGLAACVWKEVYRNATEAKQQEHQLANALDDLILSRCNLRGAIAASLARRLPHRDMGQKQLQSLISNALAEDAIAEECIAADLLAYLERDAACKSMLEPLLFFKGFLALSCHRVAHIFWNQGRELLALFFQSASSEVFAIDIHPAAQIGCGIMLDHGTGFVVGETAIIENCVSILHAVTLGGTGKEKGGARHPIVRSGVLLGAGAKVLGRIEIGECAKIAASSVVLEDVPAHTTVAGVPAIIVAYSEDVTPATCMIQKFCQG